MTTESVGETPEKTAKVVKRYSNRKLYDTDRSRYVTLDEIAKMIKAGEEVTIIDNESKEDLTSVTLTQIIYEEEKRESRMPLGMLRNLIQSSGTTLQDFFDKQVIAPVGQMRDTAQKSVERSVEDIRQSASNIREAATRQVTELTDSARRIFSREERKAEEFRKAFIQLFDALEDRLEARAQDLERTFEALTQRATEPDSESPSAREARQLAMQTEGHVTSFRERLQTTVELLQKLESTVKAGEAKLSQSLQTEAPVPASNESE
ncbi:MAG: polyhydroxyalkanoate synthesis regulator DNA-binding domain-containing protein [Myxococcota bacterium]